jgi:hypothetical protein
VTLKHIQINIKYLKNCYANKNDHCSHKEQVFAFNILKDYAIQKLLEIIYIHLGKISQAKLFNNFCPIDVIINLHGIFLVGKFN